MFTRIAKFDSTVTRIIWRCDDSDANRLKAMTLADSGTRIENINNGEYPRVKKVFAFDPFPVTGSCSVGLTPSDHNRQTPPIDRIY